MICYGDVCVKKASKTRQGCFSPNVTSRQALKINQNKLMADSNSCVLLNGIGPGCKAVTRLIMSANHHDCQSFTLSITHRDLREQRGEDVIRGVKISIGKYCTPVASQNVAL